MLDLIRSSLELKDKSRDVTVWNFLFKWTLTDAYYCWGDLSPVQRARVGFVLQKGARMSERFLEFDGPHAGHVWFEELNKGIPVEEAIGV